MSVKDRVVAALRLGPFSSSEIQEAIPDLTKKQILDALCFARKDGNVDKKIDNGELAYFLTEQGLQKVKEIAKTAGAEPEARASTPEKMASIPLSKKTSAPRAQKKHAFLPGGGGDCRGFSQAVRRFCYRAFRGRVPLYHRARQVDAVHAW